MGPDFFERLKTAFDEMNEIIEEGSRSYRVQLAESVFRRLVARSPIDTGSYVLSHKIGVGTKDNTIVNKESTAHSKQAVRNEALGELSKLNAVQPFSAIYISNQVGHNMHVEYIGWARTSPYHVYGLTYEEFLRESEELLNRIGSKMQLEIERL